MLSLTMMFAMAWSPGTIFEVPSLCVSDVGHRCPKSAAEWKARPHSGFNLREILRSAGLRLKPEIYQKRLHPRWDSFVVGMRAERLENFGSDVSRLTESSRFPPLPRTRGWGTLSCGDSQKKAGPGLTFGPRLRPF